MNNKTCSFHPPLPLAHRKVLHSLSFCPGGKKVQRTLLPLVHIKTLMWKELGDDERLEGVGYVFTGGSSPCTWKSGQEVPHSSYDERK